MPIQYFNKSEKTHWDTGELHTENSTKLGKFMNEISSRYSNEIFTNEEFIISN